jgi:putative addiction module component (TIGR02574 family)
MKDRCTSVKIDTMTRATQELLNEALELPLDERAKMAAELLDSLQDSEADVEAAWATEIKARVEAVLDGQVEGTDWRTVMDRIETEILRR